MSNTSAQALNPQALEAAVEAAIDEKIDGGTTFKDWVSFNVSDAAEFGVLKPGEAFHFLDYVREDQHREVYRAILRPMISGALRTYLASLPPPDTVPSEGVRDDFCEACAGTGFHRQSMRQVDGHIFVVFDISADCPECDGLGRTNHKSALTDGGKP